MVDLNESNLKKLEQKLSEKESVASEAANTRGWQQALRLLEKIGINTDNHTKVTTRFRREDIPCIEINRIRFFAGGWSSGGSFGTPGPDIYLNKPRLNKHLFALGRCVTGIYGVLDIATHLRKEEKVWIPKKPERSKASWK